MVFRRLRLVLGVAGLAVAAASPVCAQSAETRGVVQRVDARSGMVYFADGRTIRIDPGSRLFVDGREVQLADVQPGWTLVVPAETATAPSVVVAPAATTRPSRTPVDATGVVARVDPQSGTITLQDGRVLHATGRTTVWQSVPITSLTPGTSVYVRNAEPLDYRPSASAR
jgi:Cu/Ag efflux protein CusF